MLGTLKGRIVVIVAVLAVAGWYLYSNGLSLGLDLQGGTHLVLEIEDREGLLTPEARADAADRAERIIRTRIDQFGVAEPLIQRAGGDRIIVELAGIQDEERAKQIIQQTAFLQFQRVTDGLELREALTRIDRAIVDALGPEGLPATDLPAAEEPGTRIQDLLFGEQEQDTAADAAPDTAPVVDTGEDAGEDGDAAAAPATDPEQPVRRPFSALLMESGVDGQYLVRESDWELAQRYLALEEVQRVLPRGVHLRWGHDPIAQGAQLFRPLYVLEAEPVITGEYLQNAAAGRDPQYGQTLVSFEFNRLGGRVFERFTTQNIGRYMAIVLDDRVYSAPVIRSRIRERGQIEMGQAPLAEAQDLALVLRAGALPAPLQIIEERTVGPSLGQDSIDQGRLAGIVGVLLVIVLVALYYRTAGLLAIGALLVYSVLVLGGLAGMGANLTLPGIAGLILSIGMAVDANVLIFERIREEVDAGRTPRAAVDEGFANAMSAIIDSNLTTLLTALILFQFGTGPVRGFAVTLSIGIIASFFSAVYVTRTFFLLYLERRRATQPISI